MRHGHHVPLMPRVNLNFLSGCIPFCVIYVVPFLVIVHTVKQVFEELKLFLFLIYLHDALRYYKVENSGAPANCHLLNNKKYLYSEHSTRVQTPREHLYTT